MNVVRVFFFRFFKLILCFAFIGPVVFLSAFGQEQSRRITFTERDRKALNSYIRGVKLELPESIRLKGEKADLSPLIRELKKIEQSDYNHFGSLWGIKDDLGYPIRRLCKQAVSPEACWNKADKDLETAFDEIRQKTRGRILYPKDYQLPSEMNVSDRNFGRALEILDSECAEDCGHYPLDEAFIESSPEQYQNLYNKVKNKSKKCQKNLMDQISLRLEDQDFPKPCLKGENKNHPVCKNMLESMGIISQRVSELADLAYGPEPENRTEAQAPCVSCELEAREEEGILDFKGLRSSLEERSSCAELKPGEEKEVYSGVWWRNSYLLKREPNGDYSVIFPLRFSADEDYDGPVSKESVPEYYMQEVQKCLSEANQKMLGPHGEKLKIKVQSPSQNNNETDVSNKNSNCLSDMRYTQNIFIGSKDHNSNAGKYGSDIDCPMIVHELLHLTGLCDEYKETKKGFFTDKTTGEVVKSNFGRDKDEKLNPGEYDFKLAYDCRVTAGNSIMADSYERWDNVKNGKNKSLLTATQFQSILYGACEEKNKKFNECSRLAYQSSQTAEADCMSAKRRCERENGMGHNKWEQIEALQKEIDNLKITEKGLSNSIKRMKDMGKLNWTFRDRYERDIAHADKGLKSAREELSNVQSEEERVRVNERIKSYRSMRNYLTEAIKTAQEKGTLDTNIVEYYRRILNERKRDIQDLEEKLKIVNTWPDTQKI